MRRWISILACGAISLGASTASAQRYLWAASGEVLSGAEGGGGYGASLRRTRTTVRVGGDVRIDESPENVFSAAGLVELEPRTAFGLDGRYVRVVKRFAFGAGVIGFLAPSTLFGGTADVIYRHPLSETTAFTIGPSINVFFLGSDLPEEVVFWQAVLRAGFRADL